ncbi:response regulator [Chelatococcus asaccharovorans]|uniref:Regulatory protein VirG n=1 Tax=Chelatococcus asaccharovorans TaxID=28210 RepID=A0A2V3U9W6_9HYPH|nr:response regulator [Chelatococcus asaccharovorans]MBS7705324.1 response regulator [Chelatococcus asaccharovorans]PXW60273.1 two-component system phosphate regulon response regulator OmpR [Chelatococcus asaccharovorans]CAH1654766.1 Transcriptional regulatory protein AruR [Chelatococcus asaccharovorans]CAH1685649.1 Transcriptional regulatory protein AruR [Chelatococcus asaccharovorans]
MSNSLHELVFGAGLSDDDKATAHILVVDDEVRIRDMLYRYFDGEGFKVTLADGGPSMRAVLEREQVDLVLLDLMMPGDDGFVLAKEIRARADIGIIMLTGRSDMIDRVVGLEVGADDYIAKPFHLREVHARVKSVLRRLRPGARPAGQTGPAVEQTVRFDGWVLNLDRRQLTAPTGEDVALTTGEFDLLSVFVSNPGRVLDRDRLMDLTRGRQWEAFDRTIDAQVGRLRRKLDIDPKDLTDAKGLTDFRSSSLIKSVRGVGYVFTGAVSRG